MKFRCLDNSDMENGQLTIGKIYEGRESEQYKSFLGVPYIEIDICDDGVHGLYLPSRFEKLED